jgi:hypothetical protein
VKSTPHCRSYRHDDADALAGHVSKIVGPLADLIARARRRDEVDLIYVNDNYGDFTALSPAMSSPRHWTAPG